MKYMVKLNYSSYFLFDNIEETGAFFDQALKHSTDDCKYATIEPVYPDAAAEEVSDD